MNIKLSSALDIYVSSNLFNKNQYNIMTRKIKW